MAQQTIGIGAVANDGTGDPLRTAFDKCNSNFTELYAGLTGLLDFKGSTDASANPNYPAASKGDFYLVSVAGKIGGASGVDVEAGDSFFATADNAGGDQATVGASWTVLQGNMTGGAGATTLDGLSDVSTAGAADGDVLAYDSASSSWGPAAPGGGGSATSVNAQSGTSYTLVLGDAEDVVELTNAAAITLTIPANASVAFPVGTAIEIHQGGAGTVTVAPDTGVTLVSRGSLFDLAGQEAVAAIRKVATDTWRLTGDIA